MTSSPGSSVQGSHYAAAHLGKIRSQTVRKLLRVAASSKAFLSLAFRTLLRSFAVLQLACNCEHDNLLCLGG